MKHYLIVRILFLVLLSNLGFSQRWADEMQKPDANLYQIQTFFEQYWSTRDITEKGKGYKAFRRWENFVSPRVYPSGDLSLLSLTAANYETFLRSQSTNTTSESGKLLGSNNNLIASATWTAMGPNGPLAGNAGGQFLKSGRLNFLTIDPTNTLNLWVGAPAGGLWSSTNGGSTWSTNTDQLSVIGCSDLVIDPTNTSVMYLATGDGDGGDTRSIGVLKSTNGGSTWSPTGLTNTVNNYFLIRKLIINPNNTQIVLAATNTGIYRTTNGGTSWTQVYTPSTYDLEFKPGDPNIVYAGATVFLISTNGGSNFTTVTNGIPNTGFQRLAIAVTPADPAYVYVLGANAATSGFQGLYRSVSSGTAFAAMSTSANINLLGWNSNGADAGGQGWYDLCIAASPLDKDEIVTGGVNVWRSLNGGTNWSLYGHWTGSGAPFTHADHHDLEYATNGTLFNCNDGTVYRRTSSTWQEISGQMNISQIYKIGLSGVTANKWITGHQDNGTSIWTGTSYNAELGGDGMDCFFDRTNDQNVFGEYQNGAFQRSTNGGTSWTGATSGMTGTSPWVTIWKQDPQTSTTLYAGRQNLHRSTNLAVSWSTLTALPAGGNINEFAIAPSNNQVIYVLKNAGIYKTTNAGTTWSTVTNGVPVSSAAPQFITIDPTDPNNAWVVLSGYSAGNKVFMTTNGGSTWTNFSSNLPNLPGNCLVYQPGTNDMIYVGMDVGIYFRNNTSSTWTLYNAGLPNVPISDMEISPASPTLIHAASYGRGVWVASVYSAPGSPLTIFSVPAAGKCSGATITFTDISANTPNAWSWTVSPSAGVSISSATVATPTVIFPSPGNYTVSLQATNSIGQGSVYTQVVTIASGPTLSIAAPMQTACSGSQLIFTATGANTYSWSNNGGTGASGIYYPTSNMVYNVTGTSNSCTAVKNVTANVLSLPVVGITGANLSCAGDSVILTASGAVNYTWNTVATSSTILVNPLVTTSYSVSGSDVNGCSSVAYKLVGVYPLPVIGISANDTMICAQEEIILSATGGTDFVWAPVGMSGSSITVTPLTNITYTVTGTDINGCKNNSVLTVLVSVCDGLSSYQIVKENMYSVFPNPTKGKLTIKSSRETQHVNAQVFDISGKKVSEQVLNFSGNERTAELNLSGFATGTYLVKLISKDGNSENIRVIKE